MFEKEVVVHSDVGVHIRPAMMIVQEASKYSSEIFIVKDKSEANAKSMMSILGLAIVSGSKVYIRATGSDEKEAVEAIVKIIENNFQNHV